MEASQEANKKYHAFMAFFIELQSYKEVTLSMVEVINIVIIKTSAIFYSAVIYQALDSALYMHIYYLVLIMMLQGRELIVFVGLGININILQKLSLRQVNKFDQGPRLHS